MQISQQVASIRDAFATRLMAVVHEATSQADMSFAETLASSRCAEPEVNRVRSAPTVRTRAAETPASTTLEQAIEESEPVEDDAKDPERTGRSSAPPTKAADAVAYASPGAAPPSAAQSAAATSGEPAEEATGTTTDAASNAPLAAGSDGDAPLPGTPSGAASVLQPVLDAEGIEAGAVVEGKQEMAAPGPTNGTQLATDEALITPAAQKVASEASVQVVHDNTSWKDQFLARLLGEPHGGQTPASPTIQGDTIAVTVAVTADAAAALQPLAGQPGVAPVAAVEGAPGATGVSTPVVATVTDNSVQATGQPGQTDLGLQAKAGAMKAGGASTLSAPLDGEALREVTVRSVRLMLARGEQTVTVRLSPPSLGELHVQVTSGREGLTVRLASANPAVREALNGQLEQLEQALVQADSGVTGLTVASDLGPALDQAGRQAAQGGRPPSSFTDSQDRQETPAGASTLSTRSHTPHDGALDVVV